MARSNIEQTREFQRKMRTQGAAGFAAGPWEEIEESLGMDQSVVVDQEGNPVWSVKHTRKPRQTISRSAFDRLMGGVAVLALATLLTSLLAIYYEQSGENRTGRIASSGTAADRQTTGMLTLPPPPAGGFIDRPSVEVVAAAPTGPGGATDDRHRNAPAAGGNQPAGMAAPGTALPPLQGQPAVRDDRAAPRVERAAQTGSWPTLPATARTDEAEKAVPSAPERLAALEQDPVQAIEAITLQESPAAIGVAAASPESHEAHTGTLAAEPESPARVTTGHSITAPVREAEPAVSPKPPIPIAPSAAPDVADTASVPAAPETPGNTLTTEEMLAEAPTAGSKDPAPDKTTGSDPALVGLTAITASTHTPDARTRQAAEPPADKATPLARLEPATPASVPSAAPAVSSEPGEDALVTADEVPQPGATGRWIINLASYAGPRTARRMQQKFEDLGVSTDKQVAEVNGKTMYRLRIASFESRRDAEAYFESIRDRLGLESAWITKQ